MATEKISLEAFLRARAKNHTEDVRLQQILATYSLEKKQWERRVFNETFEQRHLAYALKREADEIKKREKKKREQRELKMNIERLEEEEEDGAVLDLELRFKMDSGQKGIVINTSRSLPPVLPGQEVSQQDPDQRDVSQTSRTRLPDMGQVQPIDENPMMTNYSQNTLFTNAIRTVMFRGKPDGGATGKKKVNMAEIVARLFPKSLRRARSMADLERLKCLDPAERVVPPLDLGGDDLDDEPIEKSVLNDDYWIGDPKAIGSVRRPRLPPEVMSARSKNIGDVMKLIRDLPVYPSCTKNCNKPGAKFDEMMTSRAEKTMMPSLVNANVTKYHQGRDTPTSRAIGQLQATIVSFPVIRGATYRQRVGSVARHHQGEGVRRPPLIRSITVTPSTKIEHQVVVRNLPTR